MICYFCQGQHFVYVGAILQPCAECGGTGELNCCEGLQAQPEPEPPATSEQQAEEPQAPGT